MAGPPQALRRALGPQIPPPHPGAHTARPGKARSPTRPGCWASPCSQAQGEVSTGPQRSPAGARPSRPPSDPAPQCDEQPRWPLPTTDGSQSALDSHHQTLHVGLAAGRHAAGAASPRPSRGAAQGSGLRAPPRGSPRPTGPPVLVPWVWASHLGASSVRPHSRSLPWWAPHSSPQEPLPLCSGPRPSLCPPNAPCPRSLVWPQDKALISCQHPQHKARGGRVVPRTPHPWPLATRPHPWHQPRAPSGTAAGRPADTPLKPGKLGSSRGQSHPRVSEPHRPSKFAQLQGARLAVRRAGQGRSEGGRLAGSVPRAVPSWHPTPVPRTHRGHPRVPRWPVLARSEVAPRTQLTPHPPPDWDPGQAPTTPTPRTPRRAGGRGMCVPVGEPTGWAAAPGPVCLRPGRLGARPQGESRAATHGQRSRRGGGAQPQCLSLAPQFPTVPPATPGPPPVPPSLARPSALSPEVPDAPKVWGGAGWGGGRQAGSGGKPGNDRLLGADCAPPWGHVSPLPASPRGKDPLLSGGLPPRTPPHGVQGGETPSWQCKLGQLACTSAMWGGRSRGQGASKWAPKSPGVVAASRGRQPGTAAVWGGCGE